MAYELYRDILGQVLESVLGAQAQEQARYGAGLAPYQAIANIYQPGGPFEQAARQEAYRGFARYLNPQQAGLFRMRNVSTLKPAMAASIGPQIQLARTQGLAAALGGLGAATQRYPLMPNFGSVASMIGSGMAADAAAYQALRRYPPASTPFSQPSGGAAPSAGGASAGGATGGGAVGGGGGGTSSRFVGSYGGAPTAVAGYSGGAGITREMLAEIANRFLEPEGTGWEWYKKEEEEKEEEKKEEKTTAPSPEPLGWVGIDISGRYHWVSKRGTNVPYLYAGGPMTKSEFMAKYRPQSLYYKK